MNNNKETKFDKLSSALKNNLSRRKLAEKNKEKNSTVLSKQDSEKKSTE